MDIDAVLSALKNGEMSLPCLLADIDEPDRNRRVTVTLV